ncbi:hypothetical protein [Ectopseudomonas hydrolytica]|uniref:hypothetical protein n=1 Tax=Ectopseudomonas hydrolytica TaxID=2493633 RepID=UPI00376F08F0
MDERSSNQIRYWGVWVKHPILNVMPMAPFPTAAEAGAAIDRLSALYPTAEVGLGPAPVGSVDAVPGDTMEEKVESARTFLALACGELEPYSAVEAIEAAPHPLTAEYAGVLAAKLGCSTSEIVTFESGATALGSDECADHRWVVFRLHLQTFDFGKAETKAMWVRRQRAQAGADPVSVSVVVLPLARPAIE